MFTYYRRSLAMALLACAAVLLGSALILPLGTVASNLSLIFCLLCLGLGMGYLVRPYISLVDYRLTIYPLWGKTRHCYPIQYLDIEAERIWITYPRRGRARLPIRQFWIRPEDWSGLLAALQMMISFRNTRSLPPSAQGTPEGRSASSGHLVLVIEDQKGRRGVVLGNPYYSIGRSPSNHIRLFDSFVSREHAVLIRIPAPAGEGYTYRISDGTPDTQPSTNGVFVNGNPVQSHPLSLYDRVQFGPQVKAVLTTLDQCRHQNLLTSYDPVEFPVEPVEDQSKESFSAA